MDTNSNKASSNTSKSTDTAHSHLHLRISSSAICFATYNPAVPPQFNFERYAFRPQTSLTSNLYNAVKSIEMLQQSFDRTTVYLDTPVTSVPLAEFQEEDVEATYHYCFTGKENVRVFYDTVPAAEVVLLSALDENVCHITEDLFGQVHYTACLSQVAQYLATKGLNVNDSRHRMFVYTHDGQADVAVFEDTHLVALNTFAERHTTDTVYYVCNIIKYLGLDHATLPIFVCGENKERDTLVNELQKFATKVYLINPVADFNRHIVASTPNVPYDLMCALLK